MTTSCLPSRSPAVRALALTFGALALTLGSFVFSAPAHAVEYHTTCVGHGFVAGGSPSDGSFFSRVETGCGSGSRDCDLYSYGVYRGGLSTTTTTCNAWSNSYGSYTECASYAKVYFPGQFSQHNHTPDGYCAFLRMAPPGYVDPIPDEPLEDGPDVEPTGSAIIGATARDSDTGPDFAVRLYRSKSGWTCPEAGRVQDGRYGQLHDETFVELELASAGACADLTKQPVGFAISNHAAVGDRPAYALVFGAVSEDIVSVSVRLGGKAQELPLVSGTFIAPTTSDTIAEGGELIATTKTGETIPYELPVPSS